ncbi:MAG TPA: hypothetical protein H9694_05395 [Firmicutes bacterium]|nr:hypothetical protein [Bacillota bacterium]
MAREMYLVGVDEEELRPEPKPEGPKKPKDKLSNFWYHYKWAVIVGIIVVAFLAVVIGQIVLRDDPDYQVLLVTETMASEGACNVLEAELAAYGRDLDGDGKVEVNIESLYTGSMDQIGLANRTKLMAHLSAGDVMFIIMDQASYEDTLLPQLTDDYRFYEVIGVDVDGMSEDGRYWNWKDDPMRSKMGLDELPENLYFGVREAEGVASGKKSARMNEECLELLRNFLTKTVPDQAAGDAE